MHVDDAIRSRRSIRKFQDRDVPDSVLRELLDLARFAPSSLNGQPWEFIIVRDRETKRRLVAIKEAYCPPNKRHYPATLLQDAPVVLIVCVDQETSYDREVENGMLATANILLAAHARNLGSVCMTAFAKHEPGLQKEIRRLVAIPEHITPVTIIPVGYPAETPQEKSLLPLEPRVHHEHYSKTL
jgi:nitroreductase